MTEFLIYTYSKGDAHTYTLRVVGVDELMKILDKHRSDLLDGKEPEKIAIFKIGNIVLDWS